MDTHTMVRLFFCPFVFFRVHFFSLLQNILDMDFSPICENKSSLSPKFFAQSGILGNFVRKTALNSSFVYSSFLILN